MIDPTRVAGDGICRSNAWFPHVDGLCETDRIAHCRLLALLNRIANRLIRSTIVLFRLVFAPSRQLNLMAIA